MQGLQGIPFDDPEWLQAWLARINSESELLQFVGPMDFTNLSERLSALSIEDPVRFKALTTDALPQALLSLFSVVRDEAESRRVLDELLEHYPELSGIDRGQVLWLCRQLKDADRLLDVVKESLDPERLNLAQGLENWQVDLKSGAMLPDTLRPDAFELGVNLAQTPGDVVFENQLFQLIQYRPTTETVHAHPVLLIPAYVNRYYILDLTPETSLVRWLVDAGHTVFLISWVNPTALLSQYDMTHYVLDGALAALDQIDRMMPRTQVQLMGYCAGGVIASILAAWLSARGEERVASLTLLTTLLDYEEAGPLGQLVSEARLSALREPLTKLGYLPAELMLRTFASLRPHDLLVGRFLSAYFRGERGKPFPLLHWLGDGTRTPAALVIWTLEHLYLHNRLVDTPSLVVAGQPIDLSQIKVPVFLMAAEQDEISPWQSVMRSAAHFGGEVTAVLGQGGHNAGVIHDPTKPKRGHYVLDPTHAVELSSQTLKTGSWWPTWGEFLAAHGGEMGSPIEPGGGLRPVIEPAPGRYVSQR